MKNSIKEWLSLSCSLFAVLFALCAAVCRPACAFNAHQPFDIASDVLDYDDETQVITARGHVVIVQSSSTLNADLVRYDRVHRRLIARGRVVLHEKEGMMLGDQMDYDLAAEKGVVLGGKGYASSWYFQGASWEKHEDYYIGRNASFTSCDLIDPHYHIRSARVHVIPDKLFWAWSNVFYIDTHPVFYSPFLYHNLGDRTVEFQVQPGEDSIKGAFAKTTTTFRIEPNVYDRLLIDKYTIAGTGYGNELDYLDKDYKGSLFGYYINPKGNAEQVGSANIEQYNLRAYHWQKLTNELTLQANIDHRENVGFNNEFFTQDPFQAVSNVTNSTALTFQNKHINQRLVVQSDEGLDAGADPDTGTIHTQDALLPHYEITLFPIQLWTPAKSSSTLEQVLHPNHLGPLQFSANGATEEYYSRIDGLTRERTNGGMTLTQPINLSRDWSLTPSVSSTLNWQDKYNPFVPPTTSTTTYLPIGVFRGYQGRVSTSDNLRYRASSDLTLDQTYNLTERMAPNAFMLDRGLNDGGIETNHIEWTLFWRPSRLVMLRSLSGYDLRTLANEDPNTFRQRRVDPWTNQLTFQPSRSRWQYYFQYQLGYWPTQSQSWEMDARVQGDHKTLYSTGLLYNRSQPGFLTWNNTVGYYFSPGWRVDTILGILVPNSSASSVKNGNFTQTQFIVTRDMHCWTAQFIYKDIAPYTHEFSLLFNLKLGATTAQKPIANEDLEAQFYPWRAGTDVDHPVR
jgi:hypothetical protein